MAGQAFFLVPFEQVAKGHVPSWQYALVNKDKKMFKMAFTSEDEVIDALFEADEIWYGADKFPNALFGKRHAMQVQYDFECSPLKN